MIVLLRQIFVFYSWQIDVVDRFSAGRLHSVVTQIILST